MDVFIFRKSKLIVSLNDVEKTKNETIVFKSFFPITFFLKRTSGHKPYNHFQKYIHKLLLLQIFFKNKIHKIQIHLRKIYKNDRFFNIVVSFFKGSNKQFVSFNPLYTVFESLSAILPK